MPLAIKECPGCGQTKRVTEFGRDKHSQDGFYTYCKECDRRKQKESYNRRKKATEAENVA
jgi:hypothetical protein